MFGLDSFQVILILLGGGFIAAGLFGLLPALTGSRLAEATSQPAGKGLSAQRPARPADIKKTPDLARALPVDAPRPAAEASQPAAAKEDHMAGATTPITDPGSAPAASRIELPAPASSALDQDVVDELFAELFALRSSVSNLASEVRDLRNEQRGRRLLLREVIQDPARSQKNSA